jgi:hypothetical protein
MLRKQNVPKLVTEGRDERLPEMGYIGTSIDQD